MQLRAGLFLPVLLAITPHSHLIHTAPTLFVNSLSLSTAQLTRPSQKITTTAPPPLPIQQSQISTKKRPITVAPTTNPHDLPYESAILTLNAYKSLHGDLAIPRRYTTPPLSIYPREWHHTPLSTTIYTIKWWKRHVSSNPSRVAELNSLGFLWERLQPEWNLVLEALVYYHAQYGHVMVPISFVVPKHGGAYPPATWGINLGSCVRRIRSRLDFVGGHPDRVEQLNGLGFVWDWGENRFQMLVTALKLYGRLGLSTNEKVLRVPIDYVVPGGSPLWPEELWGYPLGVKCDAVRMKGIYVKNFPERRQVLKELGFWFGGNSNLGWLEVVHAAAIYSKMHGRKLAVPTKFIVPAPPLVDAGKACDIDLDWPWPEQLWGLPLGQRLRDVRLKGRYLTGDSAATRKSQLDALGFEWNPKRGRRKRCLGGGNIDLADEICVVQSI